MRYTDGAASKSEELRKEGTHASAACRCPMAYRAEKFEDAARLYKELSQKLWQ